MRRLSVALIATVSAGAFTQIAAAADMLVKAPRYAPSPQPVYSWTGFYVGGNVGYSWGKADSDINTDPVTLNTNFGLINIPGFVGSDSVKPKGIIGGGQIGYNWQFSPNWVAGLEADWQASGEKASHSFTNAFSFFAAPPVPPFLVTGSAVTDYEAKILGFGTLRGRIGYAWDRVLLYATGGLAYGEIKLAGTRMVSGTVGGGAPFLDVNAIGHSKVNAGWTVGAGIEGALTDNWTWKAEYLYMDLGSLDDPDGELLRVSTSGGTVTTHTNFTDNLVRVGLNYKFH